MTLPPRIVPLVVLAFTLGLSAPAAANFDELPGEPFDAASNTPYASVAPVTKVSPVFDTQPFGVETGETGQAAKFLGCGRWGSKTAWVRFATRVSGRAYVTVDSSIALTSYDVFFKIYTAPVANSDYSLVNDVDCHGARVGLPDEQAGLYSFHVPPGESRIFYVQTLSVCEETDQLPSCDDTELSMAPGGNTRVTLTYYPDNRDGDAIPDSLDACPAQGNPCAVDGDGDKFFKNPVSGAEDCDDGDPAINPGRREIRGNRKDDDCKAGALPFLRVTNAVTHSYRGRRGRADSFGRLFVRGVRRGLRVVVECKGKGCPGPREYVVKKARKRLNVRGRLGRARLAPGATVTVKLLRKGRIGRVLIYRFRKRGVAKRAIRCTLPGSRKVQKLSRCKPQGADAADLR